MALENNSPAESGAVSRRTIIKGAAWAAPVMIAAVAVPAAVASPNVITSVVQTLPLNGAPPVTALTRNASNVAIKLTVTPAFSGIVYLTLASGDKGYTFASPTGSGVAGQASFVAGAGTIHINTPAGAKKTATLNVTSDGGPNPLTVPLGLSTTQ